VNKEVKQLRIGTGLAGPGRNTVYNEAIAKEICERLANGEALKAICRDDHMPDPKTVRTWASDPKHPFSPLYTRAREIGYHGMADELLEIADDGSNDWMRRHDGDNEGYAINGEHSSRSRMRIDTRKWLLAKALPRIYGDKIAIGGDQDNPIRHEHRVIMIKVVDPGAKPSDGS
jgi:hypothetical protein